MNLLESQKSYNPRFFACIRVLLGVYLAYYLVALFPYAADLYATGGIMPLPVANPLMAYAPFLALPLPAEIVHIIIGALVVMAMAFAAGIARIPLAIFLWIGLTALYIRNPLTEDPSMAFVNLLLLFTALVPTGEGWSIRAWQPRATWYMPQMVYLGAWIVLEVAYTASGIDRLLAPSWQDGSALHHLFTLAIVFDSPITHFVQSLPAGVLIALTYGVSLAFLLALPLCIAEKTRPYAWALYMVMFIIVGLIINLTEVILGVLLYQLFLFDVRWVREGPYAGIYKWLIRTWTRIVR